MTRAKHEATEQLRSAWVIESALPRPFLNRLRSAKIALRAGATEQEVCMVHGGVVVREARQAIEREAVKGKGGMGRANV